MKTMKNENYEKMNINIFSYTTLDDVLFITKIKQKCIYQIIL